MPAFLLPLVPSAIPRSATQEGRSHRHFAFLEDWISSGWSRWFGPRSRSGPPKNKISSGAELLLAIGYYAAAG
jgi:hypothetical protein